METTEYKPTYEQLEKALTMARDHFRTLTTLGVADAIRFADELNAKIETILTPPPTYKEVTVDRWECDCGNLFKERPEQGVCPVCGDFDKLSKLTGTRRVPVKQPVRKRVAIRLNNFGELVEVDSHANGCIDIREAYGKSGNFEWEE